MTDLSQKKELAGEAEALIDNKAFGLAILSLRKRWFEELLSSSRTDEKIALVERIKALEAVPAELQIAINDYKMALAKQGKHG